jgi:tRNA G10  N-methylase Trm11
MVFVTKAIQDIEAFGARDYGRPGRSAKRGMLPPKLARIMINLAEMKKKSVLLDPFCGSGTVLMEAGLMEYNTLIGSDISSDAISDTKKSLEWLKEEYHLTPMTFTLHKSDAGKINKILKPKSVDCIITEPYLGKPLTGKESKTELEQQAATLKTLYLQAFTSFRDVLKKDGTIIFAIPAFRYGQQWIHIDCTKEMQKIGFIQKSLSDTSAALLYARKNQHVGRSISKWQCQ